MSKESRVNKTLLLISQKLDFNWKHCYNKNSKYKNLLKNRVEEIYE